MDFYIIEIEKKEIIQTIQKIDIIRKCLRSTTVNL